ncbi:Gfo/Idh/MocA family protein [Cohnella silvisoli]|uniref:Gfo/Idh/MocA family oxidoreductase n=1 Tax=Cohnella silvisoli TaxID=2873699 RepID=A0ABV1KUE7_9BACL|nr:Gfo/Idh/MocA family oxidoreductase [Cohnella silvisoli]MCD9023219.1 Gfo/Idh/MocA family oxidoreductase [Cohnella silvisoli]
MAIGREVGIGVIGLGGMARYHIEQLGEVAGARITALCDVSPQALAEVGAKLGVPEEKRYASIDALIGDEEVEGIVSVTPNDSHAAILKACIKAGKPLFAEKPLTRTLEEASEVLELYRRNPIPLLINFSYRNGPAFQYAREFIGEGRLGRINHLFVQYMQDWGSTVKNTPFLWRFDEAVTGTGTLGDLGSHMMDIAEYLTGSRMTELQAMLQTIVQERQDPKTGKPIPVKVDDFACFNARFEDGAVGVFQTSRNALGCGNQHEVTLYGEAGTLHVSTLNDGQVVWTYPKEDGSGTETETIEVPRQKGLNPWREFAERIRGEQAANPEFATLEDGYRNQLLLEAVVQAHQSRSIIAVESVKSE